MTKKPSKKDVGPGLITTGASTSIQRLAMSGKISSIIFVLWVALFVAVTFGTWKVLLTYGQKENLSGLLTAEFYTKIGVGDWTVSEIGGYPAQAIVKWANSNGLAQQLQQNLDRSLLAGLAGSTGGLLICIFLWRRSGRRLTEDTLLRGTEVREASEVIKKSKNDRALDLSIGGVHLQGNRYGWPGHILFCGSPRTGKTVAIEGLLQTIRENHPDHSVVLYDRKGSYVEKWYDKTLDVIANPLDSRMQDAGGWDLWEEVREPLHIEELATAFLPMPPDQGDPIWVEGSRTILAGLLRKMQKSSDRSMAKLLIMLMMETQDGLSKFLRTTTAAGLVEGGTESKFIRDLRAILSIYARPFTFLTAASKKKFSFRRWVDGIDDRRKSGQRQPWLFLSCRADQAAAMRPLQAGFIEILASAIQSLPEDQTRKIWLIIDEADTLHTPRLHDLLAVAADRGAVVAMGIHSVHELSAQYGETRARAMLSNIDNVVIFGSRDADTAKFGEDSLGQQELEEARQGIRYAGQTALDAVSLSREIVTRAAVSWSDLMKMEQLKAWVRILGLPVTQVDIVPVDRPKIAAAFVSVDWKDTVGFALEQEAERRELLEAEEEAAKAEGEAAKAGADRADKKDEKVKELAEHLLTILQVSQKR